MSMNSTGKDMSQAVLEGVAFALRDSFEVAKSLGINIESTKICGGGAKSKIWVKIIANVLNINVEKIEVEEGPALGAAMLAAVGCNEFTDVKEAANKIIKVSEIVKPNLDLVSHYDTKYKKFKEIYPTVKDLYTKLIIEEVDYENF